MHWTYDSPPLPLYVAILHLLLSSFSRTRRKGALTCFAPLSASSPGLCHSVPPSHPFSPFPIATITSSTWSALSPMADFLSSVKRIVIKIGSSILVENQQIALHRIEALCKFVADLQVRYEVILVTSGAVAAGYTEMAMDKSHVPNKQALASMGQPLLMHMYYTEFQKYNIFCAQMLLAAYDLDSRKRTVNAHNAVEVLVRHKVIPIIENDATALRELVFGDNDNLSAHVAHHFKADLLVILSDIDGYYTANPRTCKDAEMRLVVHELKPEELVADATPNNQFATGGIVTKLQAAQFLLGHGEKMYLSSGFELGKARKFLLEGQHESGTLFLPKTPSA